MSTDAEFDNFFDNAPTPIRAVYQEIAIRHLQSFLFSNISESIVHVMGGANDKILVQIGWIATNKNDPATLENLLSSILTSEGEDGVGLFTTDEGVIHPVIKEYWPYATLPHLNYLFSEHDRKYWEDNFKEAKKESESLKGSLKDSEDNLKKLNQSYKDLTGCFFSFGKNREWNKRTALSGFQKKFRVTGFIDNDTGFIGNDVSSSSEEDQPSYKKKVVMPLSLNFKKESDLDSI